MSGPGFAEDCALLVQAWLDLYEATFDCAWIERAEELQQSMDENFWDPEKGGYFNSAAGAADVVVRLKEDYDGAEPAGVWFQIASLLFCVGVCAGAS